MSIFITAILATFRGVRFLFGFFERMMLSFILVSFGVWWYFDAPLIALLANIGVSITGMLLNIRKVIMHPGTEAVGPWTVTVLANFINLFAIGSEVNEWILPSYLFFMNGCMLLAIIGAPIWGTRTSKLPRSSHAT